MKNQIDQSTPFLAFYDLLRIRGIYSDEEKREKLRRGFRRAMALAAILVGLLLPQGAGAAGLIAQKATGCSNPATTSVSSAAWIPTISRRIARFSRGPRRASSGPSTGASFTRTAMSGS